MSNNSHVFKKSIDQIMNDGFARYAKYIIQDRALPDIRDGLKPVQRRILFAMYNLGIDYDKPYKKSARTVGEVIGKYHPHGDSSIYEAMVRMSQEWKNNIPLLDMHGNKGSIDGDNAAAMRYTECRLSLFSQLMLKNIDKNTVQFIPNFDDTEDEPTFLPSLLPNLLINGATGIAAGYATNIPPFNIIEVVDSIIHRIDNPNCKLDTIKKILIGPDFPTGGIIQGTSGIYEAYETGKGKFIIRSEMHEQPLNKKIKQLVITSIPYETNKAAIIKSIDDLIVNEKLNGVIDVRDESDKNGINIVLDIEIDKSIEVIKNILLKNTSLQIAYTINFVAIHNKKPVLMPILEAIDAYITHALGVVKNYLIYDLNKALKRLEIIKGLIKAISILDDIIITIRKSLSKEDSKKNLMLKFGFSEIQAEAIVNLRLYKLSATDIEALNNELKEVEAFVNQTKTILNSDELLRNHLKKILREYKNVFNIKRKTIIEDEIQKIVIDETDLVDAKDVVLLITNHGYLKATTRKSIEASKYEDLAYKEGDILLKSIESNTLDYLILISSFGQLISIPIHKIKIGKYKDAFEHVNNLITLDPNESIINAFTINKNINESDALLLASKNGSIKRMKLNEILLTKNPKSVNIFNLKDNDELVSANLIDTNLAYDVISITKNGYAIRYDIYEIPLFSKNSSGVKSQKLNENDFITQVLVFIDSTNKDVLITANRGLKRVNLSNFKKIKRAGSGSMVMSQVKSSPYEIINAILVTSSEYINVLNDENKLNILKTSEVPLNDFDSRFSELKLGKIKNCFLNNLIYFFDKKDDNPSQERIFFNE